MSFYNNSCLHLHTEDNYILSTKGLADNSSKANFLIGEIHSPFLMMVLAIPHPA
jgi:hypothetical protein